VPSVGRFLGRVAGRVLLVALGLLLVELGFRGVLLVRGTPYSAEGARGAIENHRAALQGGIRTPADERPAGKWGSRIHPYIGWWTWGLENQVQRVYRNGAAVRRVQNGEAYEIWLLGGSVATNFANRGGGRRTFLERLMSDPGFRAALGDREPHLRNFAHAAHKQPQQLTLVGYLLAMGLVPDAIVNLDGFNEVAVANANAGVGANPTQPSLAQWGTLAKNPVGDPERFELLVRVWLARAAAQRVADEVLARGLERSACVGSAALEVIGWARARWTEQRAKYERKALDPRNDPSLRGLEIDPGLNRDAMIRAWYESSAALHSICAGRGIPYLHVLQPTLHDPGAKPWTDEERASSGCSAEWLDGVRFGYPRLREAGQKLHDEQGVAFFDASHVFADVEETLYYDACHFDDEGNRILAVAMADAFVALFDGR
jgi:hypothetical protein